MKRFTLFLASVAAVVGLLSVGCNGDDNPNSNGNGNGGNNDDELLVKNTCTSAGSCQSAPMPDGKTWTTENLNVQTSNSWCYENKSANCDKYGRLYTWDAAKSACQLIGMRLPSDLEWEALEQKTGTAGAYAGEKLKSRIGWDDYDSRSGDGTDNYGFTALPGGYRSNTDGGFYRAGRSGNWWTVTAYDDINLGFYHSMVNYIEGVYRGTADKSVGYSVRCVLN